MPRWMQTSTTRWLRVCLSSFNNRSLWRKINCVRFFLTVHGTQNAVLWDDDELFISVDVCSDDPKIFCFSMKTWSRHESWRQQKNIIITNILHLLHHWLIVIPRWLIKKDPQIAQKVATLFLNKRDIIRNSPKRNQNICVTFARQFVAKIWQKSPNLVKLTTY